MLFKLRYLLLSVSALGLYGCCDKEDQYFSLLEQTKSLTRFEQGRVFVLADSSGQRDSILVGQTFTDLGCPDEHDSPFTCDEDNCRERVFSELLSVDPYRGSRIVVDAWLDVDNIDHIQIQYNLTHPDSQPSSTGRFSLIRNGRNSLIPAEDPNDCQSVTLFETHSFADTTFQGVMRINNSCLDTTEYVTAPLAELLIAKDFGPIGYTTADGRVYELVAYSDE